MCLTFQSRIDNLCYGCNLYEVLHCLKRCLHFKFYLKGLYSFLSTCMFSPLIKLCTLKTYSLKKVRTNFVFLLKYFCRICEAAKVHGLLEQELAHAVNACSHALNKANPRFPEVKEEQSFIYK